MGIDWNQLSKEELVQQMELAEKCLKSRAQEIFCELKRDGDRFCYGWNKGYIAAANFAINILHGQSLATNNERADETEDDQSIKIAEAEEDFDYGVKED